MDLHSDVRYIILLVMKANNKTKKNKLILLWLISGHCTIINNVQRKNANETNPFNERDLLAGLQQRRSRGHTIFIVMEEFFTVLSL